MRVGIVGSGAWGTAMALHLHRAGASVLLWSAHAERAEQLRQSRENGPLLPGVPIPPAIHISSESADLAECLWWFVAVPTVHLRATVARLVDQFPPQAAVVSLTKGIEQTTFERPSQILGRLLRTERVAVLSGPSHAEEVARGYPCSLVVAADDQRLAETIQQTVNAGWLRVYTNSDVVGVELAGALKNVISIAAGISDGLGLGDNAKAALLTRGLVEMARFGVAHGAAATTFQGLAGLGDLIATCTSRHSRNRQFGERIGRGERPEAILAGMAMVVEGYTTCVSAYQRAQAMGLDMPITAAVYRVLYQGATPQTELEGLMHRRPRSEQWW
jgi:glycerol-3-phosphate dehydrogenase (NAD(P)+)